MPNLEVQSFIKLKESLEQKQAQLERDKGALAQMIQALKDDYEVSSLQEAKRQQRKIRKELLLLKTKLEKDKASFMEKWQDELEIA